MPVQQLPSQSLQPSADTALDGPFRLLEHRRDFAIGVTPEVGEDDRVALSTRQCGDGLGDIVVKERGDGRVVDRDAVRGLACEVREFPIAARAVAPQQIDGSTVGVGVQEGPQRAAVHVEAFRPLPKPHEDLLDDLIGLVRPAKSRHEAVEGGGVAVEEGGQRFVVAPSDPHDQGDIAVGRTFAPGAPPWTLRHHLVVRSS